MECVLLGTGWWWPMIPSVRAVGPGYASCAWCTLSFWWMTVQDDVRVGPDLELVWMLSMRGRTSGAGWHVGPGRLLCVSGMRCVTVPIRARGWCPSGLLACVRLCGG